MKQSLHALLTGILCTLCMAVHAGSTTSAPASFFEPIKIFSSYLIGANGNMADGNRVVFAPNYSNAVDGNDALKMTNPGENFGLLRDNKWLSVEARQPISSDTLFYKMTNLTQQTYKLKFVPKNLEETQGFCELIDNFLQTRKFVSLSDSTITYITVTSDPLSKAQNRLMVVFSPLLAAPLPVKFTSISAERVNNDVSVKWNVENELNIQRYELQRSEDGNNFSMIGGAIASAATGGRAAYNQKDFAVANGTEYYRVKAVGRDGKLDYSAIVKVSPVENAGIKASISLYPNPVTDRTIQVQFSNYKQGIYTIRISNAFGQVVFNTAAKVTGAGFVKTIILNSNLSKGIYSLSVSGEDGKMTTQQIVIN